jgi:acyl CoA:acetate/3-ketoacid CoA transferase alpha subunit
MVSVADAGDAVGADSFSCDISGAPSATVSAAHSASSCAASGAAGTVVSLAFGALAPAGFSNRPFTGGAADFIIVAAINADIACISELLAGSCPQAVFRSNKHEISNQRSIASG